jgi:hypothetical protein
MQIAASLARKPEKKLSLMAKAGNSKIKDLTLVVTSNPQMSQFAGPFEYYSLGIVTCQRRD